jgi:hypothetical protein
MPYLEGSGKAVITGRKGKILLIFRVGFSNPVSKT